MVCPKSGRQGRQVQTLRSKEHSLENRTRCRSMLQPTKDRTTVIVEDNDLHVDVIIGVASEQRRSVMGKGEIPDDHPDWASTA